MNKEQLETRLRAFLSPELRDVPIRIYESLTSTNVPAAELALSGAPGGALVIAESQTAGRGRLGRSFFSPPGTGLYMSMVLRPEGGPETASLVTPAAAAAVCLALWELYGLDCRVKWVNDIFYRGKKVCGILAEGLPGPGGGLEALVVGIGVNCAQPEGGFPPELRETVGSLGLSPDNRFELAAAIASRLFNYSRDLEGRAFLEEYRRRMFLTGRRVSFFREGRELAGTVEGLDENCGLILRLETGGRLTLTSGEVSIGSAGLARASGEDN